jgi:carboxymethylenebutenolidase
MGRMITFKRPDGTECNGYLASEAGKDSAPGLVVIQEWWGLNDQIKAVADRCAAQGYRALVPDLYKGKVTLDAAEAKHLMTNLNFADAAGQDIRGAAQHLKQSSKTVGVVGFCMGGALALYAASKNSKIGACVVFYGIHPKVKPDLPNLQAPVLGNYGEKDHSVPPAVVHDLERQLKDLGKQVDMKIYKNADHAFFNDTRPEVYDAEASADAWQRTIAFLREHLSV